MKSGYTGADIWLCHSDAQSGRHCTAIPRTGVGRTKFTSIYKAELLMLPTILIASFVFWQFFWHTSQIPSAQYRMRTASGRSRPPCRASGLRQQGGSENFLLKALKPDVIVFGGVLAFALYGLTSLARPTALMYYGLIGGMKGVFTKRCRCSSVQCWVASTSPSGSGRVDGQCMRLCCSRDSRAAWG